MAFPSILLSYGSSDEDFMAWNIILYESKNSLIEIVVAGEHDDEMG